MIWRLRGGRRLR